MSRTEIHLEVLRLGAGLAWLLGGVEGVETEETACSCRTDVKNYHGYVTGRGGHRLGT